MQMRTKIFEKRKDFMEGLNAYISPVDPNWRKRLIPPEPENLAELQMYLEMQKENPKIPESYLKFACYVAKVDGGLLDDGEEFWFTIPSETENISNNDKFDKRLTCVYDLITGLSCYIDLKNDGKISKEGDFYISSSFEKYLFQRAVQKFEERYFPVYLGFEYKEWFSFDQKRALDIVLNEFIQRNQMQTVWFNDEYFFFAYNQEYSFWITQLEYYCHKGEVGVTGIFYGNDIDKIQRELLPQIEAVASWIREGDQLKRLD